MSLIHAKMLYFVVEHTLEATLRYVFDQIYFYCWLHISILWTKRNPKVSIFPRCRENSPETFLHSKKLDWIEEVAACNIHRHINLWLSPTTLFKRTAHLMSSLTFYLRNGDQSFCLFDFCFSFIKKSPMQLFKSISD